MRLEVATKGKVMTPVALACDGRILLREVPLTPTDQQPMEVRGGQLTMDRMDTKSPHITLHGAAPGQALGRRWLNLLAAA